MTYPDSVSRVRPPKTTIPNTLAALPSNQYATLFDVVSGKLLALALDLVATSARIAPSALVASTVALLRNGWVDFHRTDFKTDGRGTEDRDADTAGRIGELRQGPYTKSRRESRGAAARS